MRYQSQEKLRIIGKKGQAILLTKKVGIIGIGGLGCNVSMLLARAGIGYLRLVDQDVVMLENLQRQNLFNESDVGLPKSLVAGNNLFSINSGISTEAFCTELNCENAEDLLSDLDLIIDCTDNFEVRFLINDYCVKNKIPWIFGAAIGTKGSVFNILPKGPCLRCIIKENVHLPSCETEGVLNSLTAIIGALQANEAIKVLLGKKHEKELLRLDLENNKLIKIKVKKMRACSVCVKKRFVYLNETEKIKIAKRCGSDSYHVQPKKGFDFFKSLKKFKKNEITNKNDYCILTKNLILFNDGRAIIKATSETEAKSIYTNYSNN